MVIARAHIDPYLLPLPLSRRGLTPAQESLPDNSSAPLLNFPFGVSVVPRHATFAAGILWGWRSAHALAPVAGGLSFRGGVPCLDDWRQC